MKKLDSSILVGTLLLFCAAAPITSSAQAFHTVYSFCSQSDCRDGDYPLGLLIQLHDGNFYGTTYQGGNGDPYAMGVVYKLTPSGALTVLANFTGLEGGGHPYAGVIQGRDGNLYGVTTIGGNTPSGCGAAVKVSPSGGMTVLHAFAGVPSDGCNPFGPLIQASDGNFYGTSSSGGNGRCGLSGCGTVFKMTPSGAVSVLYNFKDGTDGGGPSAGLLQASDGYIYGETAIGGTGNYGTIFKVSLSGAFTTLHTFNFNDGYQPDGGLIHGSDGNFYGTTLSGGTGPYNSGGTVFKMTPAGTLTTLYSFCSQPNCTDGRQPIGRLVQAPDGNIFGTTWWGGATNRGTVFAITPSGSLSKLYDFCSQANCTDGAYPHAGLTLASNGNFYGVTKEGGTKCTSDGGCGTAFSLQVNEDTLTVSNVGSGTVTSTDGFINCPGTCSHLYPHNAPVTMNASAAGGWSFGGWSGACTGTGSCQVTMTQNQSVTANFSQYSYQLSVSTSAHGSVTSTDGFINCPGACNHTYLSNTQVTLNANPALGWSLSSWGGACSGNGSCHVTMTQNQSVSATFTQNSYTLTVAIFGDGTVSSTDGFISCPGTCSHTYLSLTQVTLNAAPADGWVFGGWNGGCMGTASCTITMTQTLSVDGIFSQTLQFVAITTPCRLVDTRNPTGTFGGPPIQGRVARSFPIPQQPTCNIPSTAQAYSLNVTLVPISGHSVGFLTVWPTGENLPNVSLMNSWDGRFKANAAIVPAGSNGAVSVFSSDTTNVVLDIDGYFVPTNGSTLAFYPLSPCRVADTRNPNGPLGGPYLKANHERDFPVLDATACNIPTTAQAYSLNFTVVPRHDQVWVFTAWPFGQPLPGTSILNDPTGTVVANAAILPAGTGGKIATSASADTDLAVDINGYFAPAGLGGLSLYPTAPCRVLDTRTVGNGAPFTGQLHPPVDVVHSVCGAPSSAHAFVFNATILPAGAPVYVLTLWPDGGQLPNVSTLNAYDAAVTSNMAIVPTTNGSIDADAAGLTQLILDISGYFAP